jgi:hypothetical protein
MNVARAAPSKYCAELSLLGPSTLKATNDAMVVRMNLDIVASRSKNKRSSILTSYLKRSIDGNDRIETSRVSSINDDSGGFA